MLGWILDTKFVKEMLNELNKLEDVSIAKSLATIKSIENKSKLIRLIDADFNLIQAFVSCGIFDILIQIQKVYKKKNLLWACMECNNVFDNVSVCWKCFRCMLWFHATCKKKYPRGSGIHNAYCEECYTTG